MGQVVQTKLGKGVNLKSGVVVIPQDPNALIEMLPLPIASFQAGNTGVRTEITGICDELFRQVAMSKAEYKNLMMRL